MVNRWTNHSLKINACPYPKEPALAGAEPRVHQIFISHSPGINDDGVYRIVPFGGA